MNIKFNHQLGLEDFQQALVTKEENDFVIKVIIFDIITSKHSIQTLYDTPEDAPIELKALSGTLERALTRCETENQKVWLLLNFKEAASKIISLTTMSETEEQNTNPTSIAELLKKLVGQHINKAFSRLKKVVEDSKGDFNKFLNYLDSNKGNDSSIDEMIRKAFDNNSED